MENLTGYERTCRMLKREPADRIGVYEHFWSDTYKHYATQGHIKPGESYEGHFNLDIVECWPFNAVADLDFKNETVEEGEDTILVRDGNGALLRRHKHHDTTPEHVGFAVKSKKEWDEVREKLLWPDERRINFESYRKAKQFAKEKQKFFTWSSPNVF